METSITNIEPVENLLKIGNYLKMWRVNFNGLRLYIQEEPFAYYSGLTGALDASQFKGDPNVKQLESWRDGMIDSFGEKALRDYVDFTATFGTLVHESLVTIKEKGGIDWGEEKDKSYERFLAAYQEKQLIPNLKVIKKMTYDHCKHAASLLQFVHDRVQEIYAIETAAKWESLKICTPIDMFCLCRATEKGEFKKETINIKTSSQISDHHLKQASCEFMMWNETYGEAENTAILRTKNYTEGKIATYEHKYLNKQEAELIAKKAYRKLEVCFDDEATYYPFPINKSFDGFTKIGEQPIIVQRTLAEEWALAKENQLITE